MSETTQPTSPIAPEADTEGHAGKIKLGGVVAEPTPAPEEGLRAGTGRVTEADTEGHAGRVKLGATEPEADTEGHAGKIKLG